MNSFAKFACCLTGMILALILHGVLCCWLLLIGPENIGIGPRQFLMVSGVLGFFYIIFMGGILGFAIGES